MSCVVWFACFIFVCLLKWFQTFVTTHNINVNLCSIISVVYVKMCGDKSTLHTIHLLLMTPLETPQEPQEAELQTRDDEEEHTLI